MIDTRWTSTAPTFVLGQSVLGKDIPCWLVSTSVQERKLDTVLSELPHLHTLVIGAFHGDEPQSTQVVEALLVKLLDNTSDLTAPIGIIPCLNPDGLAANTRTNAHGVDLNRNWATQVVPQALMEGSDTMPPECDPTTPYYAGPTPLSEPETQALHALIQQTQPKQILSLHQPYRLINYDGPAEDLANRMAQAFVTDTPYPVTADIGYPTPGSFGTYWGVERQIPVITLELPENDPLETVCTEVLPGLLAVLPWKHDIPLMPLSKDDLC